MKTAIAILLTCQIVATVYMVGTAKTQLVQTQAALTHSIDLAYRLTD